MSIPVLPGGPFQALFSPTVDGVPSPLSASPTVELVRASDMSVIETLSGGGVTMGTSGAPSHEYTLTSNMPAAAIPGDLYFYRVSDTISGQSVRLQICATVIRDVTVDINNLVAMLGGCCVGS